MRPQSPAASGMVPHSDMAAWPPVELDRIECTGTLDGGDSASDIVPSGEIVYHGWPRPDGQVTVVVQTRPGAHRPLPHLVRHSPSGLNWGFDGNGPRDLARSLLADALGDRAVCITCAATTRLNSGQRPQLEMPSSRAFVEGGPVAACPGRCDNSLLPLPYLRFAEQVVAVRLPFGKAWSLRRGDVLRWLSRPQDPATTLAIAYKPSRIPQPIPDRPRRKRNR
jgi:hypothetical protein